ncbi:hypothetical protein GOODEAATRI_015225 [Goodea atripinnis]|uniref:Uncharacterized protein n=1 Tax=Goodea atripinnis TaxID=208336 RepID=A0ABV0MIB3_9TELE
MVLRSAVEVLPLRLQGAPPLYVLLGLPDLPLLCHENLLPHPASASGCSDQPDDAGAQAATAISSQTASGPKPDATVTAAPATTAPRINPINNGPLPPG